MSNAEEIMKRKFASFLYLGLALFLTSASVVLARDYDRAETFFEVWQASCRVSTNNARGTGTFIGYDSERDKCIVFTNYHVVMNNTNVKLDFWTNGYQQSVNGKVILRYYNAKKPWDFAFIEVSPSELDKINPPYVSFGGKGATPSNNSYIVSSGCPDGRFPQAWKGKVVGDYNYGTILFQPPPVPGQSGSAIVSDYDGELFVTGILTWLIGEKGQDSSKGGAIPVDLVWEALATRTSNFEREEDNEHWFPIPPGATECSDEVAAPVPYIMFFTQDGCKPCVYAKKEAEKLVESGYTVITQDIGKSVEAKEKAKEYGVVGTPTFIVFDKNDKEHSRYIGTGKARRIAEDVLELNKKKESEPPKPVPFPPLEDNIQDEITDNWLCFPAEDNEIENTVAEEDFRYRKPVIQGLPNIQMTGTIFEDSEQRWLDRGNRRRQEPEEKEPEAPKENRPLLPRPRENPDSENPGIDENKLGGRLIQGLRGTITQEFDKAIQKAEKKADEKAKSIIDTQKKRFWKWFDSVKWFVLFVVSVLFIVLNIIGYVIAYYTNQFFKWYFTEPTSEETVVENKDEKVAKK
jgi:thiol-disulfide isomerase/thioredoxin